MKCVIAEAKLYHVGRLARDLRSEHRGLLLRMGADPHRELTAIFNASIERRVCMIDDRIAALWGVTGTMASNFGFVWLALSNHATRVPMTVIRETRKQLADLMRGRDELATTILTEDAAARRFAIFLGFHVEDGDEPRDRQTRLIVNKKMDEPRFHIPIGDAALIRLGYH